MTASLSIPSFYDNFDLEHGILKNEELKTQLVQAAGMLNVMSEALQRWI